MPALLPVDEALVCCVFFLCDIPGFAVVPGDWLVVWALSPACKPVLELGGLVWAKAVLETNSTALIAYAIENCFMPGFLSVKRARSRP